MFYVDTNGSDITGDGSIGNPWKTLSYACSVTTAGNTIHVNAGVYTETSQCVVKVGVNIEGDGDSTWIKSNVVSNQGAFSLISLSTVTDIPQKISNIKFDGQNIVARGFYVYQRSNVTFSHCTFINFELMAIYSITASSAIYSSGLVIEYCYTNNNINAFNISACASCDIHHNYFKEDERIGEVCRVGFVRNVGAFKYYYNTSYKPSNNLGQWNFTLEIWDSIGGNEVSYNEFYGGGQHLDIAGTANVKGNYDFSWWVHHNKHKVLVVDHPNGINNNAISFEGSNEYASVNNNLFENFDRPVAISTSHPAMYARNITICYNIFKNTGGTFGDQGRNIQIYFTEIDTTVENIFIYNNVLSTAGYLQSNIYIFVAGTINNIYIRNNIIEKTLSTGFNYGWLYMPAGQTPADFYIQNNIIWNNYNNNNVKINCTITNYVYQNNIISDPLFINPVVNFKLSKGSPGINAGYKVGIIKDYDDVSVADIPEIGAYEFYRPCSVSVAIRKAISVLATVKSGIK